MKDDMNDLANLDTPPAVRALAISGEIVLGLRLPGLLGESDD